ncbi:MAG: chemotaxis protein CheB, partial [Snowella sp.]
MIITFYSGEPAFLDEVGDNLVIQCFDKNNTDLYPEYSNYVNHSLKYRPSINFTMEKLANSKIPNKLGLILAGKEDDGAKGLTSI